MKNHHRNGLPKSLHFLEGQIAEVAYQQALKIARAISISSITTSVEGAFFPLKQIKKGAFRGLPGELLQNQNCADFNLLLILDDVPLGNG